MRHLPSRLVVCFLLAILCIAAPASAATITYDISASIDTSDLLIIKGSTLQWHHDNKSGAAVGRHAGTNLPTTISTSLDNTPALAAFDWLPTWALPVPNEIRRDAFSSTYTGLTPPLPATGEYSVTVTKLSGRGSVTLETSPTAANDYQLVVRFQDHGNGAALHKARIVVTLPDAPAPVVAAAAPPSVPVASGSSPGLLVSVALVGIGILLLVVVLVMLARKRPGA